MEHIPYRGSVEALADVAAGRVDVFPASVGNSLSFAKDGRANNLVVTSPKRSSIIPDVPTLNESGIKNSNYIYWLGLFGPAKINPIIVENINLEVQRAMSSSEVKSKLNELGYEQIKMSPSEFDTFVRNEIKQHKEIISRSKMTTE
jgi:tripartite-type tricarboxylate transporter receptor subunit TctC